VKRVLERFVCVRLDGRESEENRLLKLEYGPVVMGNVQNRIVSPSGENLARLPTNFDTPALVAYLARWAALYPGVRPRSGSRAPLPYFATLHQALNVAACDARPLVIVLSSQGVKRRELERMVKPLAWGREFSGRLHFVQCQPTDPSLQHVAGVPRKGNAGIYLVNPDRFGMRGQVLKRLAAGSSRADVLDAARTALRIHADHFEHRTLVEKFQLHRELAERDWVYLPPADRSRRATTKAAR
jgi:hypothetical protein